MAIFYHIDRCKKLKVDDEINLIKYNDIKGNTDKITLLLQNQVDFMFPEGVSSHGNYYYISNSLLNDTDCSIELVFELYRRTYHSNKISRFQSFFCVEKENILNMIRRLNANPNEVNIFEIECDEYEKHDMNLLHKNSNLVNTVFCDLYWKGLSMENSLYEILVKPPIKIGRAIKLDEICER